WPTCATTSRCDDRRAARSAGRAAGPGGDGGVGDRGGGAARPTGPGVGAARRPGPARRRCGRDRPAHPATRARKPHRRGADRGRATAGARPDRRGGGTAGLRAGIGGRDPGTSRALLPDRRAHRAAGDGGAHGHGRCGTDRRGGAGPGAGHGPGHRGGPRAGAAPRAGAGGRVLITATVTAVRSGPDRISSPAPVTVFAPADGWGEVLIGERLRGRAAVQAPDRADLTAAVLQMRGPPSHREPGPAVWRISGGLRDGLSARAERVLAPAEAALLPGLVLGDTSGMDEGAKERFAIAGLT